MKHTNSNIIKRIVTKGSILIVASMISISYAVASDDHEKAHKLKQAGEILPLEQIIEKARQQHTGHILETELEDEDGRYIYELELLDDDGTVWKLEYDAKNGELIKNRKDD